MRLLSKLVVLRALAGEGNYHAYRLLREGRRLFLFAKCLKTTFNYWVGHKLRKAVATQSIAFIKGDNQLRHHRYTETLRQKLIGSTPLFADVATKKNGAGLLPAISVQSLALQVGYLVMLLLTGRQRYLNLYYLAFHAAIQQVVSVGLKSVNTFVCYNDQPYDVASLVVALHQRGDCRTIVVQHGLILSPAFYFPSIAREFWAWGVLSEKYYGSRDPVARILITGRYAEDAFLKRDTFIPFGPAKSVKILSAPSYFHDEIKRTVTSLDPIATIVPEDKARFSIKLHPATKFQVGLRRWLVRHAQWLEEENESMEHLAEKFDALVTLSSTSSVDFLLRGKPVFFVTPRHDNEFPSARYGPDLNCLKVFLLSSEFALEQYNSARLSFLKDALNV